MEIELKPCPFCGGKAVDLVIGDTSRLTYVFCKECRARGATFGTCATYCATDKAIEAWNRRAEDET